MTDKPFGLAVKALVTDDQGRILLIRRSLASKHFQHKWDLPGGKVDAGEPFDAAAIREVAEETGLRIAIDRVAGATQCEMPHVRVAMLFLEVTRVAGDVRLSDEHDAAQWVERHELCTIELCDQLQEFLWGYAGQASR